MQIIYRPPESKKEFTDYYLFRWKNLREPLGLKPGSEQDELENSAYHMAAFKQEKIIAVGRLQIEDILTARVRYMAVDAQFRKQGIGSHLLEKLEKIAQRNNIQTCFLSAREDAAAFYTKNNYEIKCEANTELEIKHLRMEKTLSI